MNDWVVFIIKNVAFTGILYFVWRLFLGTKGYYSFGRFYLLSIVFLSVPFSFWTPDLGGLNSKFVSFAVLSKVEVFEGINVETHFTSGLFLRYIYFGILFFSLFVLTVRLFYIINLKKRCKVSGEYAKYKVFYCDKITAPFSFCKWIFLPGNMEQEYKTVVIEHEKEHIRQLHTVDLVFLSFMLSLLWFNPFIYLIRRDLRLLHEVLADKRVLENTNADFYIKMLTGVMFPGKLSFYNTFFTNQTKKRIAMITQKKKISKFAVFATTIVALFFVAVFPLMGQQNVPDNSDAKPVVSQEVDKLPEFPGGNQGLIRFISESVRYPEQARQEGIQGTVVVRFLVDKNGKVSEPQVISGVNPMLDNEALRVVSLLPDFEPALYNGKPTDYYLVLPIAFRLDSK